MHTHTHTLSLSDTSHTAFMNAYTNFRDKCVHVRQLTQNHAASRWVVGLVGYVCGAGDGVAVVGRRWVPIEPWGGRRRPRRCPRDRAVGVT